MVTSNKQSDKRVVKMTEQNSAAVVPQRTLLGEVNEHITCPLCRGYYIDATTIVECLHSFCRSCIIKHLQVKSYCPVCEMMINSAKPNIKLDKALQDIVYKLVPGLFQKEMERRQQFYASRPGPAASATPEQRGEDTERIIFSPEDVISFSLEYADITDSDSISSKSSDSNEPQTTTTRRFLQCPAVVNINHLKKFLSMKFDIDSTQFAIDILYKRVPLPDYYTLMDIAYIYNWKRNEPMRFFYQIIDYIAIRNRLFDIKRNGSHFPERKSSPTSTEDTNISSPPPNLNEHGSEVSSGTDSPMPDENKIKTTGDCNKETKTIQNNKTDPSPQGALNPVENICPTSPKKSDDEVEKSQFLNSFELTAKNNTGITKSSPNKLNVTENVTSPKESHPMIVNSKTNVVVAKNDDNLKRKHDLEKNTLEFKKVKIELEKMPISNTFTISSGASRTSNTNDQISKHNKDNVVETTSKNSSSSQSTDASTSPATKDIRHQHPSSLKPEVTNNSGQKRTVSGGQHETSSPKRKPIESQSSVQLATTQKMVSPLKIQLPKVESIITKHTDTPKPATKKMPDLKPSTPLTPISQSKGQPVGKLRMDLLANNCDPTIDRSKILSQVKSSLPMSNTAQASGDPLKSLFDSCKINIPSSLSITLTDQKLDSRNQLEQTNLDQKNNVVNKNLSSAMSTGHKVPSPPVHNYIEILKLPDTDAKKQNKTENSDKTNPANKNENNTILNKPTKPPESAKGPVPNLKPIADAKLSKQTGNFVAPITFQQTFEQQLQTLQSDKKPKIPKAKTQVPKLVPATPKTFAANKLNNVNNSKASPVLLSVAPATDNKTSAALDLSTPHNIQSQLGPQQTKAFETMQSIANLAKKQNISSKVLPQAISQGNTFSSLSNRTTSTNVTPLRAPSTSSLNQMKLDKVNTIGSQNNISRQEGIQKSNQIKQTTIPNIPSPGYQISSLGSPNTAQPSPRSQTRSPSSSPKLVIAEDKQASNNSTTPEQNANQSNQITSTQIPNLNPNKTECPKPSAGPSKSLLKPVRSLMPTGKMAGIRQPITPNLNSNTPINTLNDYRPQPQQFTHAHHAILRHQMQNAWLQAQQQLDLFKNISNMAHQPQNDYNNKDKQ